MCDVHGIRAQVIHVVEEFLGPVKASEGGCVWGHPAVQQVRFTSSIEIDRI